MTELFLPYQLLHRHFKRIGYCYECLKAWLCGIGDPLGNSCWILTEFVGQPLIVQVAFGKNDSYTI